LLRRLEEFKTANPREHHNYLEWEFLAECYVLLGRPTEAAALYERSDERQVRSVRADSKLYLCFRRAWRCLPEDRAQARQLLDDAETYLLDIPEPERHHYGNSLRGLCVEVAEYRKALDLAAADAKRRAAETSAAVGTMCDYASLGYLLRRRGASEPLEEVRTIIRMLPAPADGKQRISFAAARAQALARSGLPDEAATQFAASLPPAEAESSPQSSYAWTIRCIVVALAEAGRPREAAAFLRRYDERIPTGERSSLAFVAARLGDDELATTLADAAGGKETPRAWRALTIAAHRAGDYALRDRRHERCRAAYQAAPLNAADPWKPLDPEGELAVLDAALGRYEAIERLITERDERPAVELQGMLLITLLDKAARARRPQIHTWLDFELGLVM